MNKCFKFFHLSFTCCVCVIRYIVGGGLRSESLLRDSDPDVNLRCIAKRVCHPKDTCQNVSKILRVQTRLLVVIFKVSTCHFSNQLAIFKPKCHLASLNDMQQLWCLFSASRKSSPLSAYWPQMSLYVCKRINYVW